MGHKRPMTAVRQCPLRMVYREPLEVDTFDQLVAEKIAFADRPCTAMRVCL